MHLKHSPRIRLNEAKHANSAPTSPMASERFDKNIDKSPSKNVDSNKVTKTKEVLPDSADKTIESLQKSNEKNDNKNTRKLRNQTKNLKTPKKNKGIMSRKKMLPCNKDEEEKQKNKTSSLNTPTKSLSQRKDVVYKTLIRSLKRYLTDYCDLKIIKGWSKKDKEHSYFAEIDKVFNLLYLDKTSPHGSNRAVSEVINDRDFMRNDNSIILNPENLKIYMCIIIIPDLIKPYLK